MSYLSFENNIIEASGNLILKSTSGSIDCSGATISNVIIEGTIKGSDKIKVTSIEASLNDISFNNSNLLDVSSIQVNNDVSCSSLTVDTISSNSDTININKDVIIDGSLIIQTGELTLIKTKDLDISDNIIGLNRGNISKNTSGMLINYRDASNIFFGYHKEENAFVIAYTDSNHNDSSITLDSSYVDLKVGNTTIYNDSSHAILEVKVRNDAELTSAMDKLNSEIRVFGSMLGESKIVWGEENRDTNDGFVSQYGGCIYYDGNTMTPKTEFRRITIDDKTHNYNSFSDSGAKNNVEEHTVFEYSHDSNNVTFCGNIQKDSSGVLQNVIQINPTSVDPPIFYGNVDGNVDGSLNGDFTGNICITHETTNAPQRLIFTDNTVSMISGSLSGPLLPLKSNTNLLYNPDSNTLTCTNFSGTATYANNINITNETTSDSEHNIIFTTRTTNGNGSLKINNGNLKYNPDSNTLTCTNFSGTADNATYANNINITNETTSDSEHNIIFTTRTTNGNGSLKIDNGNLKYNPDSNTLTSGSFNATSDYRTKTNIEELDENITVSNLRPLVYLKNGQKEIGLLAHELQEVYPFMVCGEKDGEQMQSVNYNGLIGVLINDIKRLTNENQILKLNNDTLKFRLDSLEEKFNKKFE